MDYFWLIPLLIIMVVGIWIFYRAVKNKGPND
jgi:paraquat-inducible protein B